MVAGGVTAIALLGFLGVSLPPVRSKGTAEWRRATSADSIPSSIAEAEARGGRHPRSVEEASFYPRRDTLAHVGTAERRCVDVGTSNVVRAGDFIAMPFALYIRDWKSGMHPPGKVSWLSAHARPSAPLQLVLRATRIDAATESYVYKGPTRTLSWGFGNLWPHGWATAAVFDLPSSGRWLIVATLDQDWGCVVLSL
jgi:hypothetical protein